MKGVPNLWTEQRVVAPACGFIDVQIRRVHVEVAHQHDGYVQLKQFRRVAIQAPEPAEFIVELRAGRWVAIRQVQASDQHAVDGRLYIAALIVVGVARKAAPDRALLLNPNSARTLQRGAWNSFYNGQYDKAVDRFRASIRASPLDPRNYNASFGIGFAFFGKECVEAAVEWLEAAMATRPSATFVHRVLASALAHLGRVEEARRAADTFLAGHPGMTVSAILETLPKNAPSYIERFAEGMRKSGIPD